MAGLRSKRIQDYAEKVWRGAVADQFGIEPVEPDRTSISVDDGYDTPGEDSLLSVLEERLASLIDKRTAWDNEHSTVFKNAKTHDPDAYVKLQAERKGIAEAITRQKHAVSVHKNKTKKDNNKAQRVHERNLDKELVRERLRLNAGNRVFSTPVRFHVRVHNISTHLFDSPNAYPTVKPTEDAGTRTGVLWDDDNNSCIPITTFRGAPMLGHDYILDIIVESIDTPLSEDPFAQYEHELDEFPKY
jgi:hypothetical protein